MRLRLTYQGNLWAATRTKTRADHKHEIRKAFQPQLRKFWEIHPYLKSALYTDRVFNFVVPHVPLADHLAEQYSKWGYQFVPLITHQLRFNCSVHILFLRPSMPGGVMNSGDLDNRLKTIFDALRMPENEDELGKYKIPDENEKPFYCLMTDDKLISNVSMDTDILLEKVKDGGDNEARLVITVELKAFDIGWDNISFG